jgi:hypothetical protein
METPICVLDDQGTIVDANEQWCRAALVAACTTRTETIDDYFLHLCNSVAADSADGAAYIAAGIRSVLRGEREVFSFKYSRQTFTEERGFDGLARRIQKKGESGVLITHNPVRARPRTQDN